MKDVLAIVLAGGAGERLYPLTRHRAKPAVTFGGIYRLIDFTLSNCVNSCCHKVMVLVQYKSLSLSRHIRAAWNIVHTELGEFIEVIPAQKRVGEHWYLGTADAIYQNLYAIEPEHPKYVLVLSGDHVYKMDYRDMLAFHRDAGAQMTIAAIETPLADAQRFGVLETDSAGRILGFEEKPERPKPLPGRPDAAFVSMGVYLFDTQVLKDACQDDADRMTSHDFAKDIIPRLVDQGRVFAYNFGTHGERGKRYWRDVGTIDSYWRANMDLVEEPAHIDLYEPEWPIRTNLPLAPPAKFHCTGGGQGAGVSASLVSAGCEIRRARVHRSVLSPLVKVGDGAEVEECVLMHGVTVGEGARLRHVIVDKYVDIPPGAVLGHARQADERLFQVTRGGVVVVERKTVIDPFVFVAGGEASSSMKLFGTK
ncbi:MAG: glucose-1-phosphate adenylyltransferase [Candidatus Hydrogenedentes bacterium]|nr:glucose-1-phosphate adenylyltransferase [Candidatus Hydrogenedentota bacterium]